VKGSNSDKWKEEMKDEMKALERNDTWDLVELPRDKKKCRLQVVLQAKEGC
jgi:hypothetical protein